VIELVVAGNLRFHVVVRLLRTRVVDVPGKIAESPDVNQRQVEEDVEEPAPSVDDVEGVGPAGQLGAGPDPEVEGMCSCDPDVPCDLGLNLQTRHVAQPLFDLEKVSLTGKDVESLPSLFRVLGAFLVRGETYFPVDIGADVDRIMREEQVAQRCPETFPVPVQLRDRETLGRALSPAADVPQVVQCRRVPPQGNGVALGELQGAEQLELDSAGDVPDGRLAGPAPGCPRVDAWPLVTVRQAPGRGGDVPECGRRSARSLPGP
jgi:hypothetical protein